MYTVKKITTENIKDIEFSYNDFFLRSFSDYGFEILPLDFPQIASLMEQNIFNILCVYKDNAPKGFLIYNTIVEVVEISIMHCIGNEDIIGKKEALITALKEEMKDKDYKLISYAMMGAQKDFVKKIARFGFEFVGQAIVKFKFDDEKSLRIFNKVKDRPTPEGFEVVSWDVKYAKDIINLIYESFQNMQDYKFDPRFKSLEGCEDILAKIIGDIYGIFLPKQTKILLENGIPKGFCLVNLTIDNIANVPLVGISPELKYKGMGQLLLTHALGSVIEGVLSGELKLLELNATLDTDNLPAINMYRKLGFKESTCYPQAYCNL